MKFLRQLWLNYRTRRAMREIRLWFGDVDQAEVERALETAAPIIRQGGITYREAQESWEKMVRP